MFTDVVNRADMRMVQRGCRARFAEESFDGRVIAADFIRKKLQSDASSQTQILRFIDDTHPAASKFVDHAIVGYRCADHGGPILRPAVSPVNAWQRNVLACWLQ